jgi:SAM-dependent methyltransferase
MQTWGVDVNPFAAEQARLIYGFDTHIGTLASAFGDDALGVHSFDLVIYQFVLEHLSDPASELALVYRALSVGGLVALAIPSAEATEVDVFGASYRSLRADHLHLFSRRSIVLALAQAGLQVVASKTECNIHLLAGFLSVEELDHWIYGPGLGPDLIVLARRPP